MGHWLLIDDSPEEAAAFADSLSINEGILVQHLGANDAAIAVGKGEFQPAGVLMDVDLSNEIGRQHTGPGMSQDMRVAQNKRILPPFPIIRFSFRNKIIENIGSDSSSDDVFDLKIEKDGLSDPVQCASVVGKLFGVQKIYDDLNGAEINLPEFLGLNEDLWSQWGNSAFSSDFEIADRVHLKAAPIVRIMVHPGLLIDENVLAFRLGVDRAASAGWPKLLEMLVDCKYSGIASEDFARWWARAIENWWQEKLEAQVPLAGCSIGQRIEHLSKYCGELVPLEMPKGSMGDRPWRHCLLTKEQRQMIIPIDPAKSVRIKARSIMPSWLDPLYAALGVALQNRDDPRIDKADLQRLQILARNG